MWSVSTKSPTAPGPRVIAYRATLDVSDAVFATVVQWIVASETSRSAPVAAGGFVPFAGAAGPALPERRDPRRRCRARHLRVEATGYR